MTAPAATGEAPPAEAAPTPAAIPYVVAALVAASAVAAGAAGCAPTGVSVTDVVLSALLGAAVTALGARARPLALGVAAVVALVAGGEVGLRILALLAVGGAIALAASPGAPRRPGRAGAPTSPPLVARAGPAVSAVVATLVVQVLLRLPLDEPVAASAVIAGVGVLLVAVSGWRGLAAPERRVGRGLAVVLVVLVAVGGVTGAVAGLLSASSLQSGVDRTLEARDAVRAGETERVGGEFRAARADLRRARSTTSAWWALPARHTPLVAPQLAALDAIGEAGARTADLAADGADRVDTDGLKLVDGRLDPAAVGATAPVFEQLAAAAAEEREELASGVPGAVWQVPPVVDGLERFLDELTDAEGSARTGALAARLGPDLLGAGGQARYFVAFVTPSEARGTGFLGSYGELTVTDGKVELATVGRSRELEEAGAAVKEITGPPDYLERYSRFEPQTTWRNVTFTPDGPTAAEVMAELYPQSGGAEVDGVIRIDPAGLARLLKITGPVELEGLPFDLDATNVEQFLLIDQYRIFSDRTARIDVLGDVADVVFEALTEDGTVSPAKLARTLGLAVRGGNVSLWLPTDDGAELVDRLGVGAAVPPVRGDGFGVVTQNVAANKIDAFLQRTVRYRARVDAGTGVVRATAEIGLANTAPDTGEPDYIIGNLIDEPAGTNRMYLSLYSPLDLVSAEIDGAPIALEQGRELDRNVWSTFVDVAPGSSATVTVEMEGEVDLSDGAYRFDLLPQVMARPDRVDLAVEVVGGELEEAETTATTITRGDRGREVPIEVAIDGAGASVDVPEARGPFSLTLLVRRSTG